MSQVLVVDDDPDIRLLLRAVLEGEGHSTTLVADGAAALVELRARRFDLAVFDVQMPVMDGWSLLRRIRDERIAPATRKLMLTAMGTEADWRRAYRLGADRYLTKPLETRELSEVVDELLTGPEEVLQVVRQDELHLAELLVQLEDTLRP